MARHEFSPISDEGVITILNEKAEIEDEIILPNLPEITGLFFSKVNDNILYITEASSQVLVSYNPE